MASSVIIDKQHIESFFQPDLNFESLISSEKLKFHKDQSNFVSELITFLYYHYNESPIENIEKIINILNNNSKKEFKKNYCLEFGNNFAKIKDIDGNLLNYKCNPLNNEDYLKFLHKIRTLIISCKELNIEEKGELCKLERYFMKKYLKKISY